MNDPHPHLRLQATQVTKHFRRRNRTVTAVHNLDIALAPDEMVAVTGPSLSGKTTLVELLAGWRQPDDGSIHWDHRASSPPGWDALTIVPQVLALVEEITVLENIQLARRVTGRPLANSDGLAELLDTLGLTHLQGRGAYEISVGERQRVMVARALANQPDVVLADEPTAHQDRHHAELVTRLLRNAAEKGASVLVATRQPEIAANADRTITLG